ncbi:uncharacterized protein B0H18DRAFT_325136 [Fomitopsis serialis]|uniref:uncharacterized protein n=1 Tax=Fomitopsis serialis TaxID=139415 RepID=UPI0020073D34|nr:uncharacterized protein B0H18DRAFT_325136 [Neoantrodia serialis]KAH9936524.1 hypothetical protein B0H18DRAFT_325136 [Neoantrodia serialis]
MSSFTRLSYSTMRLAPLARASRRSAGQVRLAHGEAEHGAHGHGGHPPYNVRHTYQSAVRCLTAFQPMPFSYDNKRAFAIKYTIFCLTGFGLPFVAVVYQL